MRKCKVWKASLDDVPDLFKCNRIIESQQYLTENMTKFSVSTVPADGLVLSDAMSSASTVITKFGFSVFIYIIYLYMGLTFKVLTIEDLKQNGHHFADGIFKYILFLENNCTLI